MHAMLVQICYSQRHFAELQVVIKMDDSTLLCNLAPGINLNVSFGVGNLLAGE
jgi:hypothetical protein